MENKLLIEQLNECATHCTACHHACMFLPDHEDLERCIRLTKDCSAICTLTADLVGRRSEHVELFLKLCAQICSACAEECAKHFRDHCQECARICAACAASCNEKV